MEINAATTECVPGLHTPGRQAPSLCVLTVRTPLDSDTVWTVCVDSDYQIDLFQMPQNIQAVWILACCVFACELCRTSVCIHTKELTH